MSSIALLSVKGTPGVTTTALAIGAVWPPPRRALVAELDPAGGDVAMWFGLPGEPNVVTLAAASGVPTRAADKRGALRPGLVLTHCQELPGGLEVLTSPPGSMSVVRSSLALLDARAFVQALDQPAGVDVVADLGRLDPASPALPAIEAATVTALVARPTKAGLAHVRSCVVDLARTAQHLQIVLIGEAPYSAREVAAVLGIETIALPFDGRSASMLAGGRAPIGSLARLPLLRAARSLAMSVVDRATAVSMSNSVFQPGTAVGGTR